MKSTAKRYISGRLVQSDPRQTAPKTTWARNPPTDEPGIAARQTETGTHGDAEEDEDPDDVHAAITSHSEADPRTGRIPLRTRAPTALRLADRSRE